MMWLPHTCTSEGGDIHCLACFHYRQTRCAAELPDGRYCTRELGHDIDFGTPHESKDPLPESSVK